MQKRSLRQRIKNWVSSDLHIVALATLLCGVVILSQAFMFSHLSYAQGQGNCAAETATKIENPGDEVVWSAPEGQIVTKVYIKAGSDQSGGGCFEYTQDTTTGCYTITGIGTRTVTIRRVGSGRECKEISHVELVTGVQSSPSPSPSPSPEGSPSPSPESSPSPSPETSPSPSPSPASSPSPSPQASPSPSSGDTGGTSSESGESSQESGQVLGATAQKQGQVLGASTYAETGVFADDLANVVQMLGLMMVSLGAARYAKKPA